MNTITWETTGDFFELHTAKKDCLLMEADVERNRVGPGWPTTAMPVIQPFGP